MGRDRTTGGGRARRRARAIALALAISLAVHAVLIVLLARGRAPAPVAPRRDVILIEIVETPPPPAGRPLRVGPAPRPVPGREPGRPPERSRRELVATPPPPVGLEPRPRTPSGPEVREWFAEHGLAGRGPGHDLSVSPPRPGGRAGGGAGGAGGDALAEEGARVRGRVGEWIASSRAADLSRYPDAHWTDLRDRMADGFAPGMDLVRGVASKARPSWLSGWSGTAPRYGATGNPFGARAPEPRVAATSRENSTRGGLDEGTVAFFDAGRELAGGGREVLGSMVTVVAVDQDAAGVVTGVSMVRSSGNVAYDRMALGRAERMRGKRGVDLPHVARTEWAFTSEVVAPPAGVPLGFSFDASFKPARGAGGPEVRTRVELVAIRAG